MSEERNAIPLIITGICSILGTVGALWYYGYLHFAKPEDALLLSDFTMLKTVPGEDYKVSLAPAPQVAQCHRDTGRSRKQPQKPDCQIPIKHPDLCHGCQRFRKIHFDQKSIVSSFGQNSRNRH